MITGKISGFTRVLGAPADWDEERDGWCGGLAIKDQPCENGMNYMISAWEPNPDELERIKAGAPILLLIVGVVHPPVMLSVGAAPDES